MNVRPDQHKRLVESLQFVAKRPALFIGNHDPERAELWLCGFAAAIGIQEGLANEVRQLREEIIKGRGWEVRSTSSWRQMGERKMTPTDIITEMVAIEIDVLDRMVARPDRA